ncbi:hypothetical protein [Ramlibacter sp.]|uniref:type IV pilus assembly protein FimV n=1 Tax=Ramlibacter sp. TaxID=1917967 RepID=UPI002ED2D988
MARPAPARRAGKEAAPQPVRPSPADALEPRLQNAERELKSLREASQQNAAALAQLRAQVEQAQNSRQAATAMIVALAVFLAGLLGWLAWRWRSEERIARVGRWFAVNSELAEPLLPIVDAAAARRMTPMPPVPAPLASAPPVANTAYVSSPMPAANADPTLPLGWSSSGIQPNRGMQRMAGVEDLIDVHDKAEFFLSIGEHEQAIGVLAGHVHDHAETSALAWMDLLELYHRFGKRGEYELLRSDFHRHFSVQFPDFEHFDRATPSLEQYEPALGRIVALWPSRKVLEVIEESIFRQPGLPGAEPFSLGAYRDLVLLYHIAQDMAPPERAGARPSGPSRTFRETSHPPLDGTEPGRAHLDRRLIPPSSPRLGVDIDLDEAPAVPPEPLATLDFDITGYDPDEAAKS